MSSIRILDIVKPDLKGIRDLIASELRLIRKRDPIEARRRLKRFQAGMASLEANLNHNLFYGNAGGGGLAHLLGRTNGE
jgi:hypothetical protein